MTPEDIKKKALEAGQAAKRFNAKPPMWFYWVAGIVIVLGFQILRHL